MKTRIFLTAWIVYSVHFATNVVREHYPAFALVRHGTFQVDEYQGLHPDIFVHRDGHSYIGNNVASSVVAAVPLFLVEPLLNRLEEFDKKRRAEAGTPSGGEYRSPYPLARAFFKQVTERGLTLRFGASTAVTSVLLMAPLSAACVVLLCQLLLDRKVARTRALALALLFAFATPVFFRSAYLNNNLFVMYATLGAFCLLWPGPNGPSPVSSLRRFAAGACAGFGFACDYSGLVPLVCLFGYCVLRSRQTASWGRALRESVAFIAGCVPPVLFLLYSQWSMYGNPFLPGQYWMPAVNYTERGWRGFSWPRVDVFLFNLFHPSYGMFAFAPILLLSLIPYRGSAPARPILPSLERQFTLLFVISFLLFCAANQYSLMQWNCGFRYLLPVVPFVFLAACEPLARLPWRLLLLVTLLGVGHVWVLCMARDCSPDLDTWRYSSGLWPWLEGIGRETVPASYLRIWNEGVQLPWLRVLAQTSPPDHPLHNTALLTSGLLAACGIVIAGIWTVGRRRERSPGPSDSFASRNDGDLPSDPERVSCPLASAPAP